MGGGSNTTTDPITGLIREAAPSPRAWREFLGLLFCSCTRVRMNVPPPPSLGPAPPINSSSDRLIGASGFGCTDFWIYRI